MEIAIPVPDVIDRLQSRLRSQFASAVQEWSESVSALARWEDDHLLDHPTPASLADHKAAVERLLGVWPVSDPDQRPSGIYGPAHRRHRGFHSSASWGQTAAMAWSGDEPFGIRPDFGGGISG